jgi:hypothetical protein
VLDLAEFSPNAQASTGRSSWCRPCAAAAQQGYRLRRATQARAGILDAWRASWRCPAVPVELFPCCGGDLHAGHDRSCFARRALVRETLTLNGLR